MEHMTAGEIAKAVGGLLLAGDPEQAVTDICTDSRQCKLGDLYVPILGERVDGHRFIGGAIARGAVCVFTSEHTGADPDGTGDKEEIPDGAGDKEEASAGAGDKTGIPRTAWIQVEDTRAALQKLGGYCRERLRIPFVGVTGSVGKTSTRAMIATALSAGRRTFQTAGNANSQVGVPITLSRVTEDYEAAVIELGMSEPGEMTRIASIAGLDVAVMTNIGISHIQQLGSQANILREKLHITDGLREGGYLILNGDDPYLSGHGQEPVAELDDCTARFHTVYYSVAEPDCLPAETAASESAVSEAAGQTGGSGAAAPCQKIPAYGSEAGYRAVNVAVKGGKTCFDLQCHGRTVPVVLPVVGIHHVRNALAALACADVLGVPVEAAARALADFSGVAHRQEVLTLDSLGITVIDDSYNASPDSMRAALTTMQLMETAGRKIAVLADMWELGPETGRYHFEVGEAAGRTDLDVLLTVGELAREIRAGAMAAKPELEVISCQDRTEAARWLEANRREGDLILLKGSNGMKLFEIVEAWKKNE